jgi:hypothetical protein
MFSNRSILKKSRHIGIGLLQCNLSTGDATRLPLSFYEAQESIPRDLRQ